MVEDIKAAREQLASDALTMLVLWATSQEYNAEIESLLNEWCRHLGMPESTVNDRIDEASQGCLQPPPLRDLATAAAAAREAYLAANPEAAAAAASAFAADAGGAAMKRAPSVEAPDGKLAKRPKTMPLLAATDAAPAVDGDQPYAGLGPALGRRVQRYWPKDAGRNKGDPWFEAVVTDWDPVKGMHKLTYFFMTQKEEYEDCNLEVMDASTTRVTEERVDLEKMYGDAKKRAKSQALAKSRWLQQTVGKGGSGGGAKKGGGAKRAGTPTSTSIGGAL